MRLFAFGCSYTKYKWPTWADILGREYDYFENWGQSGAGNHYIFNSLIECNQRHKFSANDTVMIMWSSIAREDRYVGETWITPGNIYSQETYSKEFVKKFADNRGYLIRDLAFIQAAKLLLDNIGCKFKFFSMVPIVNISEFANTLTVKQDIDCLELYKDSINMICPSVWEVVFNKKWSSRTRYADKEVYEKTAGVDWPNFDAYIKNNYSNLSEKIKHEVLKWRLSNAGPWGMGVYDCHPIPILHLEYLEKNGITLSDSTKQWTNAVNTLLMEYKTLDHLWKPKKIARL
jgi:hypothetical protein